MSPTLMYGSTKIERMPTMPAAVMSDLVCFISGSRTANATPRTSRLGSRSYSSSAPVHPACCTWRDLARAFVDGALDLRADLDVAPQEVVVALAERLGVAALPGLDPPRLGEL